MSKSASPKKAGIALICSMGNTNFPIWAFFTLASLLLVLTITSVSASLGDKSKLIFLSESNLIGIESGWKPTYEPTNSYFPSVSVIEKKPNWLLLIPFALFFNATVAPISVSPFLASFI